MKKICFFSGDITRSGGTEKVAIQIASELMKSSKYEICFLSLTEQNNSPFYTISNEICRDYLFGSEKKWIKIFPQVVIKLTKFIKENKVDILIDVDGVLDLFSLPTKIFTNVKVISWEHFNYYEDLGNPLRKISRFLASKFADKIITLTEEDKEYYQKNLNIEDKVEQIYNPITLFKNKKKYNYDSKIIVSAGRLVPQKGFDYLIDVAKIVFDKHNDWKWYILGEGEGRQELEEKIRKYNLNQNVILMGRVSNVEEYYSAAAMYVMTSRFEGFPLVLIEAKMNRLPIVSFECKTGPRELVKHGINGYLVDCFDIEGMATKICYLIENKKSRINFSNCALIDTDRMDLNRIIKKWCSILDIV